MQIQESVNLKNLHTFGVDVYAKHYTEINSEDELNKLHQHLKNKHEKYLILGEGSDVLFTQDFDGLIILDRIKGIDKVYETEEFVWVKTSSGENWHEFVRYCVENNWGGIENLALIPGNTGAAPIQNIGAYGVELKDSMHSLEIFDLNSGKISIVMNEECNFAYRWSIFKEEPHKNNSYIISVTFKLRKKPVYNIAYKDLQQELEGKEINLKNIFQAVIDIRSRKLPDPIEMGNAGSFFKNPVISTDKFEELKKTFPQLKGFEQGKGVKVPAAQLIDLCGWKEKPGKNVGVHQNQALVIINHGQASGKEIYEFSKQVQRSVFDTFGIEISPEVNIY